MIQYCIRGRRYVQEKMWRTRKKTSRVSSFAEALNVCMRILSPDECRVSLKSLMIRMMEKNSRMSAFSRWEANFCSAKSMKKDSVAT